MSSLKKKSKVKIEKASRKPSESSTVSSVEPSFLKSPIDHVYETTDENDIEESYMFENDANEEMYYMDPNDPKYIEAVQKELDRKIEQAPAAKVIVSDAMMSKALSEIESSRRSSRSIVNKGSGVQAQSYDDGAGGDASNVIPTQEEAEAAAVDGASAAEEETSGCPLDKILEFLQAVMTKDFKRALVLAKEVEQLEPNNELIQEYMVVLKKIVRKEREDEEQDSESDAESGSENAGAVYSDELTTSTETESVSGEDSENSKTARSTTYYTSTGEDEDDIEEEEVVKDKVTTTWNNNDDDVSQDSLVQAESLPTEVIKDASDTEKTNDAHTLSIMTEGGGEQSTGSHGGMRKRDIVQVKPEGEKQKKTISRPKKKSVKGSK